MNASSIASGPSRIRPSIRRDPELIPAAPSRTRRISAPVTTRATTTRKSRKATPYKKVPKKAPTVAPLPPHHKTASCPICLSNLFSLDDELCIKAVKCCGYVFCKNCITECTDRYPSCPMCSQKLLRKEVISLRFHWDEIR